VLSDIPAASVFKITLPTTTTMSISSATPACTSLFTSVTLTCTYAAPTLTVSGMFPVGNNDGSYGIQVGSFFTGTTTGLTNSFTMSLATAAN